MIVILLSIKVISLSIRGLVQPVVIIFDGAGAKVRRSANILSFDRYFEKVHNCFAGDVKSCF